MMSGDVFSAPNSAAPNPNSKPPPSKKRRNLPGTPDPDAEVIGLSPKTLMATNRFVCEICNKGFQRDQNLQLHRRGHNLPWKLKQRANKDQIKKKVYICPEKTCVHHEPARALGDLTGIKKHFSRKHGEKKWKCEKCSKKYAVQSDWKAHSKTCGTREYKCDCGTLFSRKDSFITHRAFCDALAEESARIPTTNLNFRNDIVMNPHGFMGPDGSFRPEFGSGNPRLSLWLDQQPNSQLIDHNQNLFMHSNSDMIQMASNNLFNQSIGSYGNLSLNMKEEPKGSATMAESLASLYSESQNHSPPPAPAMSATALLQKAAQMGSTNSGPTAFFGKMMSSSSPTSSSTTNSLSFAQNRSELHQVFGGQPPPENATGRGSDVMMNFGLHSGLHGVEHSLTRDFLGVGGGGRPFLPQELAKFASMSSAMGLSHFTSNH
ncbi:hypothetical protein ACS0TY_027249 [Phlomoides rotata]